MRVQQQPENPASEPASIPSHSSFSQQHPVSGFYHDHCLVPLGTEEALAAQEDLARGFAENGMRAK